MYVLTNAYNGRMYVGQSTGVLNRIHDHLSGLGSKRLRRDLTRGTPFQVQFVRCPPDSLLAVEKQYIDMFCARSLGYNVKDGDSPG